VVSPGGVVPNGEVGGVLQEASLQNRAGPLTFVMTDHTPARSNGQARLNLFALLNVELVRGRVEKGELFSTRPYL